MKVPKNKTVYHGEKKYKPGSDLPDNLSFLLEKKKAKPQNTVLAEKQERQVQEK